MTARTTVPGRALFRMTPLGPLTLTAMRRPGVIAATWLDWTVNRIVYSGSAEVTRTLASAPDSQPTWRVRVFPSRRDQIETIPVGAAGQMARAIEAAVAALSPEELRSFESARRAAIADDLLRSLEWAIDHARALRRDLLEAGPEAVIDLLHDARAVSREFEDLAHDLDNLSRADLAAADPWLRR